MILSGRIFKSLAQEDLRGPAPGASSVAFTLLLRLRAAGAAGPACSALLRHEMLSERQESRLPAQIQSYRAMVPMRAPAARAACFVSRSGEIEKPNPAFLQITGHALEELDVVRVWDLLPGGAVGGADCPVRSTLGGKLPCTRLRTELVQKEGTRITVDATIYFDGGRRNGPGGGILVIQEVIQDATTEEELYRLATTDPLTGLLNRRGFLLVSSHECRLARRHRQRILVLFIDVDGLKQVNDSAGHAAGDSLLVQVAAALRSACRESDLVGRWGGDEFVVLAVDAGGDFEAIYRARLSSLLAASRRDVPGRLQGLGVSIGSAVLLPTETESIDDAIASADLRMLQEKREKYSGRADRVAAERT